MWALTLQPTSGVEELAVCATGSAASDALKSGYTTELLAAQARALFGKLRLLVPWLLRFLFFVFLLAWQLADSVSKCKLSDSGMKALTAVKK
jgi:hypothetical protein